MKKIFVICILVFSTLFAQEKVMKTVLDDVLLKNSNEAMEVALELSSHIKEKKDLKILKEDFKKLVRSWKKVETFYLAAEFNEDTIDTPRYIDIFHNIKEDLHKQIQRVINSKDDVSVEMYKNSFKTINALEYALYTKGFDDRRYEITNVIVNNILNRLDEINEVYLNDTAKFLSDKKWANTAVVNMLIESSFKLRDWRIGDMAGLSLKYKNKPDNKRAEYFLSKNSKIAVQSILEVHDKVMNSSYGTFLENKGAKAEVTLIKELIKDSLANLKYLQNDNYEVKDIHKLYEKVDKLHKMYYVTLVNTLGITAKILDADGD